MAQPGARERVAWGLPWVGEAEARELAVGVNAPGTERPPPLVGEEGLECVGPMFARQAAARPDAPAVTCGSVTVSYGALAREGRRVGRQLWGAGVRPHGVVGLLMDRCHAWAAAVRPAAAAPPTTSAPPTTVHAVSCSWPNSSEKSRAKTGSMV